MTLTLALLLQLAQAPAVSAPAPGSPQKATEPVPAPADPASSQFGTDTGLLLVVVKTPLVSDYEVAIRLLQEALAKSIEPERRAAAKGWRVFKAAEGDAKGNTVYVHVLMPAVPGFDYRVSLLVDELVKELPSDLLSKYREALAGPPSKLSLTELANMSVPPVAAPPTVSGPPKKPGG